MPSLFVVAPNAYPTPPTPTLPHPKKLPNPTQPKKTEKKKKTKKKKKKTAEQTLHTPLERGIKVATQRLELGVCGGGVNW